MVAESFVIALGTSNRRRFEETNRVLETAARQTACYEKTGARKTTFRIHKIATQATIIGKSSQTGGDRRNSGACSVGWGSKAHGDEKSTGWKVEERSGV